MPITYVNPAKGKAKKRATKRRTPVRGTIKRVSSNSKKAKKNPSKKKPAARKPATTKPKQGKKQMARTRKKLYGAAAAARKKRLAKLKRKRTGARSNPAKGSTKRGRSTAAKKAAATRRRNATARSAAAKKAAATRKRRAGARKSPVRKRRRTVAKRRATKRRSYKRNPAPKRKKLSAAARKRRKSYGGKRSSRGMGAIAKGRRSIKASKRRGGLSGAFVRKYKMKTNPGGLVQAVKTALPIAGSFYVSKLICNKLSSIPAVADVLGKLPGGVGKPVLAGLILAGTHYGTKRGMLAKHRTGLMLGTALSLIDTIISTFAPADVKAMIGVGDYGYGSLGEYVSTGEYVSSGEYVSTGDHYGYGSMGEYVEGVAPDIHGLHAVDGLHEVHAIHGIDAELGAIESGAEVGLHTGVFANGW